MAMACFEEPLCPSSPRFRPHRFLLRNMEQQNESPSLIFLQEERNQGKREMGSSSDSKSDKLKEKRSILSFLEGKGKKK